MSKSCCMIKHRGRWGTIKIRPSVNSCMHWMLWHKISRVLMERNGIKWKIWISASEAWTLGISRVKTNTSSSRNKSF